MATKSEVPAQAGSPLMDNKQTAAYLGKPVSWLHQQGELQGIPRYKIGKHWRYRLIEIDQWIEQQAVKA